MRQQTARRDQSADIGQVHIGIHSVNSGPAPAILTRMHGLLKLLQPRIGSGSIPVGVATAIAGVDVGGEWPFLCEYGRSRRSRH